MRMVSLAEVMKQAAKDLGYKQEIVEALMLHQFKFLKEFMKNPTSARIHLSKFGFFTIPRYTFYRVLIDYVIPLVRKERSEEMYEVLRKFLKLRHVVNKFYYYHLYVKKIDDGVFTRIAVKNRDINDDRDLLRESADE